MTLCHILPERRGWLIVPYEQVVYTQTRIRPGEMQKVLWDFEMQADHQIQARRQDQVTVNKQKENLTSGEPQSENKRKREEGKGPCQRTEKIMEHEGDGDTNSNYSTRSSEQSPKA